MTKEKRVIKEKSGDKGDRGEQGLSNTLKIGSVSNGNEANATITGESPNQILNLVLPKGDKGEQGLAGKDGENGDTPVKGVDYWNEEDKKEVKGFIANYVAALETVLQNILEVIQKGGQTATTISEIEELIVSYFENKTAGEVEE